MKSNVISLLHNLHEIFSSKPSDGSWSFVMSVHKEYRFELFVVKTFHAKKKNSRRKIGAEMWFDKNSREITKEIFKKIIHFTANLQKFREIKYCIYNTVMCCFHEIKWSVQNAKLPSNHNLTMKLTKSDLFTKKKCKSKPRFFKMHAKEIRHMQLHSRNIIKWE